MADLPSGLLAAVRNYLDITWFDADLDTKLTGIISRGIKYIDKTAGAAQVYTEEDKPRELLFDYCRYARSNALDEFQRNYLPELLSLQNAVMTAAGIANAQLSGLTVGNLALSPVFVKSTYEYTAAAENNDDAITATAVNAFATIGITVNGVPTKNGESRKWNTGNNLVVIAVTYDGVTLAYKVIVTR